MRPPTFVAIAVLSLLAVSSRPTSAHGPAPTGSGVVGLDVHAQGPTVDVLLAEKTASGVVLRHQRSRDGGATWSEPRAIPAEVKSARRGDEPQIAAVGDRLVALWTRPGGSRFGKGPFGTALSADGGATWAPGPNPADDGREDGHAFADLAADEAGTLFLAWLDSRDGAQGLRTAVSRDSGRTWEKNASPDARSCECCWNRVTAAGRDGAYVLYRDRDPRDMALVATRDGGREWTRRGPVGTFAWQLEGCPEVGGGLVAQTTGRLDAVVWTGETARQGVYALGSPDDGRTWTAPVPLGSKAARSPDLARSGSVLEALWEEKGAVYGARSRDDGRTWSAPERLSPENVRAVHPYVVTTGEDRFLAVWTEREGEGRWRFRSRLLGAEAARVD
jgi:BNR repeat-like domain